MRHLIVLSGSLTAGPLLDRLLTPRDHVVAADGGSDHLRQLGIAPDLVVGDFDSIKPASRQWIERQGIAVHRYPTAKNATDSEIALDASLAALPPDSRPEDVELVILGALGSRPDHVLGNQMMAASLAERGYRVVMSDGISLIYTLAGPGRLQIDLRQLPEADWAVSTVAVSREATGLTYAGLRYPLDHFTLPFGSSRGLSNEPTEPVGMVEVSLTGGTILICLTPAH